MGDHFGFVSRPDPYPNRLNPMRISLRPRSDEGVDLPKPEGNSNNEPDYDPDMDTTDGTDGDEEGD